MCLVWSTSLWANQYMMANIVNQRFYKIVVCKNSAMSLYSCYLTTLYSKIAYCRTIMICSNSSMINILDNSQLVYQEQN